MFDAAEKLVVELAASALLVAVEAGYGAVW
jgi:hypothetical protein